MEPPAEVLAGRRHARQGGFKRASPKKCMTCPFRASIDRVVMTMAAA
jgi:hypothetical protein